MLNRVSIWLFLVYCQELQSSTWDYSEHGPDVWSEIYPNCNGQRQSPINIRTACTIKQDFSNLSLSFRHTESLSFTLINNGHTLQGKTIHSPTLTMNGANLDGTFSFDSFHLHWGPNPNSGSEHQM